MACEGRWVGARRKLPAATRFVLRQVAHCTHGTRSVSEERVNGWRSSDRDADPLRRAPEGPRTPIPILLYDLWAEAGFRTVGGSDV